MVEYVLTRQINPPSLRAHIAQINPSLLKILPEILWLPPLAAGFVPRHELEGAAEVRERVGVPVPPRHGLRTRGHLGYMGPRRGLPADVQERHLTGG